MLISQVFQLAPERTEELLNLMDKFLLGAKEKEGTAEAVLILADYLLRSNRGGVWFIIDEDRLVGYLLAELMLDTYKKKICFIHQLYVETTHRKAWEPLLEKVFQWAEEREAKDMFFSTRRNLKAAIKILGPRWEIDSTVFRAEVKPCA